MVGTRVSAKLCQTNHSWRAAADSFGRAPRPRGKRAHNLKKTPSLEYVAWDAGGGAREKPSHRGQVSAGVRGHGPHSLARDQCGQGWPAEVSALTHKLWARRPHGVRALSPCIWSFHTIWSPSRYNRHHSGIKDKHPCVSKAFSAWSVVAFQPPLKPQASIHFLRLVTLLPTNLHLCTPPRSLYLLPLFNCNSNYESLGML